MTISGPFIRRPIATSLLMAAIVLLGIVCYPLLPVAPLPQVEFPTIQVTVNYPGASPETMASAVATPLERQFAQIPGVSQIVSTSALGNTSIAVQFVLDRGIDAAAQDIQTAINQAGGQLPTDLPQPPLYRKLNPADPPIVIIAVQSEVYPIDRVDDFADTRIAQQLSQIQGVGQVNITGEQKPSIRIRLDPDRVAALGLGLEDVRAVVNNATVDRPKGAFDGPRQAFAVLANDQVLRAAHWEDVIVAYRNGAPVRLRDVGTAVDGPENRLIGAWQNGRRGVALVVFKQPGANVVEVVGRIRDALPKLRAAVPPAVDVQVVSDRTTTIRASVSDIETSLALTFGLVVLVVFAFLRDWRATLPPALVVLVAVVGAVAAMYAAGFSLDNLSLMALVIAVGFVVDDGIVVLENIFRRVEDGQDPEAAALEGSGEIGFTVLAISISLIAVFIPLLFMGAVVGRLFREFALVVTGTILLSVFVSLTLVPTLSARLLRKRDAAEEREKPGLLRKLDAGLERGFKAMERGYGWMLDRVLRHRPLTLAVFGLTLAATVALYVFIPKGFFPQQDTGFIVGTAESAPDTSFAAMSEKQVALMEIIRADPAVANVLATAGATGGTQTSNTGRFFIDLKPHSARDVSAAQVIDRLREKLHTVPGVELYLQASQDINLSARGSRTQYQYVLRDPDLEELNLWAGRMVEKLRGLPGLTDVATDQQPGGPTAKLTIDRDLAARFGIQPRLIDDTLADAFGQRVVAQWFTQLSYYHVVMEVDPGLQADPQAALRRLFLQSPATGTRVPLSAFVTVDTGGTAYLSISHLNQFPAVTLSFNLAPGVSLGEATAAIEAARQELGAPASVQGVFQGNAQAFYAALANQPYLIAAAIVAVYIILGMLYESYVHPLTILSTLPSAGLGALLTLWAPGFGLDVMGLIGIILLIGIVKKNGIILVDFALQAERHRGAGAVDAIREACLKRFRPIMMTTMAAVLGAVPLALGIGTGAELRQPLGCAMIGGLLVSQALTLFTTPVVYIALHRLTRRRESAPAAAPQAAPAE
ncbi:acriflavine resistance protein B [Dankookia rubra]|uniref:Acriflavine resistance protein B n=1 Tax=Dankookia rubra TaxID=1442381 RepID=A0A4R5QJF8_9PROT|nr:efflux RND transporter permease subunit [Dankookia rubra]TDH63552.1 acriflavine resistance protein B [Dankookia rubra]